MICLLFDVGVYLSEILRLHTEMSDSIDRLFRVLIHIFYHLRTFALFRFRKVDDGFSVSSDLNNGARQADRKVSLPAESVKNEILIKVACVKHDSRKSSKSAGAASWTIRCDNDVPSAFSQGFKSQVTVIVCRLAGELIRIEGLDLAVELKGNVFRLVIVAVAHTFRCVVTTIGNSFYVTALSIRNDLNDYIVSDLIVDDRGTVFA